MNRKTWRSVIVSVALAGTLQACGGGGGGAGTVGTNNPTSPVITAFSMPAKSPSQSVGVNSFTATDDKGVTGFMITQSSTPPSASATGWTTTAPSSVTAAGTGSQTFYCWVKDADGNVSAPQAPATVNVTGSGPDTTVPVVTAFTLPATASSVSVSVSSFTATDNLGVTGYLITQSVTPPTAVNEPGWTTVPPAFVAAIGAGIQTFFPWAKDAAGNISALAASQTVTITLPPPPDTTAPAVTSFTMPASAASLSVSISAFTATDNVAVTGYMVTQSATPPAAGDAGWTATAPATVTAAAAGSQTFFPWVRDAAGNVSAVGTPATVTITIPTANVAVTGAGTDTTSAVGADATFTFAVGAYAFNISGFGPGDKLVFPVGNVTSILNPSPTDGSVIVNSSKIVGQKSTISVVLNGITAAQDQQIVDVPSFKAVFGANSIQ